MDDREHYFVHETLEMDTKLIMTSFFCSLEIYIAESYLNHDSLNYKASPINSNKLFMILTIYSSPLNLVEKKCRVSVIYVLEGNH